MALAAWALSLAACTSQERLTKRAIGCSDVTVAPSEFKRQGVETAWCVRCDTDAKTYQCATNAERTDVQCFEAREGGPCF